MENLSENDKKGKNNNQRNKSQTNLKSIPKEQLKSETKTRVLSKGKNLPPIMGMTGNNFHHPIYYQTTASITHQTSNTAATKKQKMEEDIDSLKQELALNRMDMNRKKNELNELRIVISKLSEDNKNNKLLIAKILGIDVDKAFTKKELIDTIINCKPTEEQKKQLREAYEVIKLKLEINGKKKVLNNKNTEINHLTKNAKAKVIKELDNEYQTKCEHQKKIVKVIKKMEDKIKQNEKAVFELEKEYNHQKETNKKLLENVQESEKLMKESEEKKDRINNELFELKEKMRRIQEKIAKEKNKSKADNDDLYIRDTKHKIEEMNKYKENKDEIKKKLKEKKNNYKKLEQQKKDQEKLINELNEKNKELSDQINQYEEEKNKLIKKANEPKVSSQKLKELEAELKSLKEENEKYKNSIAILNGNNENNSNINTINGKDNNNINHLNNQKLQKTQHISESEKEEIFNKDIIAKNKLEQEQLNKQIDYLKTQIEDVNAQIAHNQNSIDNIRKLLDDYFKTKENKNKEKNEEDNAEDKKDEEKKEEENKN